MLRFLFLFLQLCGRNERPGGLLEGSSLRGSSISIDRGLPGVTTSSTQFLDRWTTTATAPKLSPPQYYQPSATTALLPAATSAPTATIAAAGKVLELYSS